MACELDHKPLKSCAWSSQLLPAAPSSCQPTAAAAADVQREQGTLAATDLVFGLQLLREHHNAKACFWTCAFCPPSTSRFAVAKAFQQHLQAFHEMVQIGQDGQPLQCSLCRQTVCSPVPTCSLDIAMLRPLGADAGHDCIAYRPMRVLMPGWRLWMLQKVVQPSEVV